MSLYSRIKTKCANCRTVVFRTQSQFKRAKKIFCSPQCLHIYQRESFSGKKNPFFGKHHSNKSKELISKANFKGGVCISTGYFRETGQHGKLIHRKIVEEHIGRKLERHEIIHHINENRLDNRLSNLAIITRAEHMKIHKTKWITKKCVLCKKEYKTKPHMAYRRFCSKSCAARS